MRRNNRWEEPEEAVPAEDIAADAIQYQDSSGGHRVGGSSSSRPMGGASRPTGGFGGGRPSSTPPRGGNYGAPPPPRGGYYGAPPPPRGAPLWSTATTKRRLLWSTTSTTTRRRQKKRGRMCFIAHQRGYPVNFHRYTFRHVLFVRRGKQHRHSRKQL